MATIGGPNIERDGLVFGYDTGYGVADNSTSTRFYPGKSTSNSLETDANWIYVGSNITSPDDFPIPLPEGVKFHIASKNSSITWTDACRNYTDSYSAGTNITVSGWHMFHSTDTSLTMNSRTRLGWHYSKDGTSTYGGTIYTATEWNKWYYFSNTFSSTGVTTYLRVEDGGYDYYLSAEDAAKTTQYYCNLQIEVGTNIPSPFTDGTRSSTQSLIDLTKTTDIDVSNVSFDSTGQPTFNGTDDKINLGASSQFNIQRVVTIESVVKRDSASWNGIFGATTGGSFIHWQLNGSGLNCYLYGPGLAITKSNQVTDTSKFYHLVVTFDGTTARLYNNGEQVNTATTTSTANISSTSATSIGQVYSTDRMFDGNIPIVKIYSQALSADEVKQNYNAYRKRFNLD